MRAMSLTRILGFNLLGALLLSAGLVQPYAPQGYHPAPVGQEVTAQPQVVVITPPAALDTPLVLGTPVELPGAAPAQVDPPQVTVDSGMAAPALELTATITPTATATPTPATGMVEPVIQLSLDGVQLSLSASIMPAAQFIMPEDNSPVQVASAVNWGDQFKEVSIYAVPYGQTPAVEDLPAAQSGISATYLSLLSSFRAAQAGNPQVGQPAVLFGQMVNGISSTLVLNVNQGKPVQVLEWVVEAGERVWIVRISQDASNIPSAPSSDGLPTSIPQAKGALFSLSSDTSLNNPSVSLNAEQIAATPPAKGLDAVASASDLPAPSWWSGDCDDSYFYPRAGTHAYALGASYRGVKACGPISREISRSFGTGAAQLEWQCPELTKRFLYLAYGIAPYSSNGSRVVWNYSGSLLEKVSNGTANKAPQSGDVLSYGDTSSAGHTSLVSTSNVNSSGNGSITIVEQNWSSGGTRTHTVSNWVVQSSMSVSGWLHNPSGNNNTYCSSPALQVPVIGFVSTSQTVSFSWSAVSGCSFSGYNLRIKNVSVMDSGGTTIVDSSVNALTRAETIGSQWNATTLYWGVRAANAAAGAGWSVRSFRVDPASLCIPSANQVALYADANYGGLCVIRGVGSYTNAAAIGLTDNTISSLRVGSGGRATLCRDDNYSGTCETFTADDANLSGNSIGDNTVSSLRVELNAAPLTPANLGVSSSTSSSITLGWSDNSNETGYKIYKWLYQGGTWAFYHIASVAQNVTTFTDSGLNCAAQYSYQISAVNAYGESGLTSWLQGITLACAPVTPTFTRTPTTVISPTITFTPTISPTPTNTLPPTATLPPSPPGIYDDMDGRILYSGNWSTFTGSGYGLYGNTQHQSSLVGSGAGFTFNGERVALIYSNSTNRGAMEVVIDGVLAANLNQYAASFVAQQRWDSALLAPGNHAITLRHASGGTVALDAVVVSGTLPATYTPTITPTTGITVVTPHTLTPTLTFTLTATGQPSPTPTPTSTVTLTATQTLIPSITPTITATLPPVTSGVYDDMDAHIAYSGTWQVFSGSGYGLIANTMHYSSARGSAAGLTFNGGRVALIYSSSANRGVMDVEIDGVRVVSLNQYSATFAVQRRWESQALALGNHTLTLRHASGSTTDLDAIIISGPVTLAPAPSITPTLIAGSTLTPTATRQTAGAGSYDDTDTRIAYAGTWMMFSGAGYGLYNNTQHYSIVVGSSAGFVFNGTRVAFLYSGSAMRGVMDIEIDGVRVASLNQYSPTFVAQKRWQSQTLAPGKHTLTLRHISGRTVDLDALTVE